MEELIGISNEIRKVFERYDDEGKSRAEEYEAKMKAFIDSLNEQSGAKKIKTCIEDEEPDSGIDATTTTTTSTATSSSHGSARPSRATKTKANGNLKLPKLGTKLRQEIKLEPISEISSISTNSKTSETKENDLNSVNVKREKISVGVRSQSISSNDSSILVIPNELNIITLSDDDEDNDDDKMPPPMKPAPKKLAAKATRNTRKNSNSSESNTSEFNSSESNASQNTDQSQNTGKSKALKKTRTKKQRKPVLPMVEIKEEKTDATEGTSQKTEKRSNDNATQKIEKDSNDNATEKTEKDSKDNPSSKNATLESVYEDASDKIPSQSSNGLTASATYVCGPSKTYNETFVLRNAEANLQKKPENGQINKQDAMKVNGIGKSKTSYSSIITEDDSDDDLPVQNLRNPKNHKELFNPCIQSPMKAKVAAFERQAQELSSPAPPIRQTRTKTRQLAKQISESKLPKPTTPSHENRYPIKEQTPLGQSIISSKGHLTHTLLRTQTIPSVPRPASAQQPKVRSRDNSVEDLARAKEAMLDKKRKGEERRKQAQMQREAQEKEKIEKIEKLMKTKQEKEAAREALKQQKIQQEYQKQQKALEQKREKERRLKAELAEAARQEREVALTKKIAAEKAQLENMKQNKREEPKSTYMFDMLQTDDSTDDEDTAKKSHRPDPPAWSLRVNRKGQIIAQAGIDPRVVDKFFSCKPTTPDLAAIFPQIDSKNLKRNSSAFWNTPPRYSQLPKY